MAIFCFVMLNVCVCVLLVVIFYPLCFGGCQFHRFDRFSDRSIHLPRKEVELCFASAQVPFLVLSFQGAWEDDFPFLKVGFLLVS